MPNGSTPTGTVMDLQQLAQFFNERSGWRVKFFADNVVRTARMQGLQGNSLTLLNIRNEAGTGPVLKLAWYRSLKPRATMTTIDGGFRFEWPNGTWLELTEPAT